MSLADYLILAGVILAAVGAILHSRRHPGGCGGNCSSCKQSCAQKKEDPENPDR